MADDTAPAPVPTRARTITNVLGFLHWATTTLDVDPDAPVFIKFIDRSGDEITIDDFALSVTMHENGTAVVDIHADHDC